MKNSIMTTETKSIVFNDTIGKLYDQNYEFEFTPNVTTDPEHVVMSTGYIGMDEYTNHFILSLDQLKQLREEIDEVIYNAEKCLNNINTCRNKIDDLIDKIENNEVTTVDISVGDACTLDPDNEFFGNIYGTITYKTESNTYVIDILLDTDENEDNNSLWEEFNNYIDNGCLKCLVFDIDKYNEVKKSIDKVRPKFNNGIDTKGIMSCLDSFEKEMINKETPCEVIDFDKRK